MIRKPMKPRTNEQIQEYLLHPKNIKIAEKAAIAHFKGVSQKEMGKHSEKVRRLLLKAAFGEKVFRGSIGRAFRALAENRKDYGLRPDKVRQFGKIAQKGTTPLIQEVWSIKPENLGNYSEKMQEGIIHKLKGGANGLGQRSKFLARRGIWGKKARERAWAKSARLRALRMQK